MADRIRSVQEVAADLADSNRNYEWGVMRAGFPQELHRGPYEDEDEAREWLAETEAMNGALRGAFVLIRREVGPWHVVAEEANRG